MVMHFVHSNLRFKSNTLEKKKTGSRKQFDGIMQIDIQEIGGFRMVLKCKWNEKIDLKDNGEVMILIHLLKYSSLYDC